MTDQAEELFPPHCFARQDESDDAQFYALPRLVTHIDEPACAALRRYFATVLPPGGEILDLMSACVSHLPADVAYGRVTGHGMNQAELDANPQLDRRVIQDLNQNPVLPFADKSFDACVLSVSVQYLTNPLAVFADVARVLRAGAPFVVSFSNRMFPTKAVALWRTTGDDQHGKLVALYFQQAGRYDAAELIDLSPAPGRSDPLFAVTARRAGTL